MMMGLVMVGAVTSCADAAVKGVRTDISTAIRTSMLTRTTFLDGCAPVLPAPALGPVLPAKTDE